MTNISFDRRDVSQLIINLLTYKIFTQIPMSLIKTQSSISPLCALLGGAVSIFVIFLIALFFSKYSSGNILDTVQNNFGASGRIVLSLIFVLYLVFSGVFALKDFSSLMQLIAFPTSPLWFVMVFLILGGILGALGNVRSVVRLHGLFVPVILIVFLLLIVSSILPLGNADTVSNSPQNTKVSLQNILSQFSLYGDAVLLFLLCPNKESRQNTAKKIGYAGIISVFLNTLFFLAFTLKIPVSIAQSGQFPVYLLMKEVYFGRFFQRLDAMILLMAALSSMLYISLNLNLLGSVLHYGLGLPQRRITIVIVGVLLFYLAQSDGIFDGRPLPYLINVLCLGCLAVLIITAIFVKIRRMLNEKN